MKKEINRPPFTISSKPFESKKATFVKTKRQTYIDAVQNGYREFCLGTSMHGFLEVYKARRIVATFLWVLFICAAIGLTIFQVYNATDQYINQDTISTIEPAKYSEVVYPPLKICIPHWIYWFDMTKAMQFQFSYEAIVYAMSCLDFVYSAKTFDTELAEENFTKSMNVNGLKTMSAFYTKMIVGVEKFVRITKATDGYKTDYDYNSFGLFNHADLNSNEVCFTAKGQDVKSFIDGENRINLHNRGNQLTLKVVLPSFNVSIQEYNSYMALWLHNSRPQYEFVEDQFSMYPPSTGRDFSMVKRKYTSVEIPLKLFVNGYGVDPDVEIMPEVDVYSIAVKASAHRRQNTYESPCKPGVAHAVLNSTCTHECLLKACNASDNGEDSEGPAPFDDTKLRCDVEQIIFLDQSDLPPPTGLPSDEEENTGTEGVSTEASSKRRKRRKRNTESKGNGVNAQQMEEIKTKCASQCVEGCETWSYDVSVTTSSTYLPLMDVMQKKRVKIQISYPADGETLIVTENDKQTWDNFIGNVGGIIGVWTGASILSLIQMFYLCFCYREINDD